MTRIKIMSGGTPPDTPFLIIQPYNLAIILTFYSPIIIALIITSMSFIFQNFKGVFYLLWLLVFSWFRSFAFELSGTEPLYIKPDNICTSISYSKYGNSTFSMFFIVFSAIYMCSSMFINGDINYWICAGFLFYLVLDIWIRNNLNCITKVDYSFVLLNMVLGALAGILSVASMYITNTQKYLFFNEMSSTNDVCSMPKKQTFKCSVYKNGELIGSSNK